MWISAKIDEVGYIPFDQDAANLFFQRQRMPSRLIRQYRTTPPSLFSNYRASDITPPSLRLPSLYLDLLMSQP
jgi:hypothetical protein